ncbi:MAG: hypothetical protein AAF363_04330 [Bacteroidota bacterium]
MNKDAFILYWSKKRKLNKWVYLGSVSLLFACILTALLAWFDDEYIFEPELHLFHPYLTVRFAIFFIGWFLYKLYQWNKLEKTYNRLLKEEDNQD